MTRSGCATTRNFYCLLLMGLLQGCVSTVPMLAGGGLTPSGRSDLLVGASATLPTIPSSISRNREGVATSGTVVPHLTLRHGLHTADDGAWKAAPSDTDLSLTLQPGYAVAAGRTAVWQTRDGTNRYALVLGVGLEGGVLGDYGRDLRGAFGGRVPATLSASFGSVLEGWLGLQAIAVFVDDPNQSSVFGMSAVVGLAGGVRNIHVVLELQGGVLSQQWFDGPLDWHWTPALSFRVRL